MGVFSILQAIKQTDLFGYQTAINLMVTYVGDDNVAGLVKLL